MTTSTKPKAMAAKCMSVHKGRNAADCVVNQAKP
jgi:hypothetical protein